MLSETSKRLVDLFCAKRYVEVLEYYEKSLQQNENTEIDLQLEIVTITILKLLEELMYRTSEAQRKEKWFQNAIDCALYVLKNQKVQKIKKPTIFDDVYWITVISAAETLRRRIIDDSNQKNEDNAIKSFTEVKSIVDGICLGRLQSVFWTAQAMIKKSQLQGAQEILLQEIFDSEGEVGSNQTYQDEFDLNWLRSGNIINVSLRQQLWNLSSQFVAVLEPELFKKMFNA